MTETNATHATANPIDEAKAYAREAIRETRPTVRETEEPTNASYEYDAITIEDETCGVYEIGILHDAEADTFSLVERSRAALELAAEAEHELAIADLLQAVEVKVMMLVRNCRMQDEVVAAWAAVLRRRQAFRLGPRKARARQVGGTESGCASYKVQRNGKLFP